MGHSRVTASDSGRTTALDPWRRAAVYGSLWAAVEIVVGSFLHNLRVPFAGSFLAAAGVVMMTAGHRSTPQNGLIWRSALVCALMKSVSPSAVILGPMVGILMEGVLLEAMVRLFQRRAVGYLVGGALAVSWSMAQRVLNALISFGPDVVRLYVDAYRFASRSLGVQSFGPFDLVGTLVALEMVTGVAAAFVGIRTASRALLVEPPVTRGSDATSAVQSAAPISAEGNWSLTRLVVVSVALVTGMALQSWLPLWAGAGYALCLSAFVLRHYPRASRRVRRMSLWIELAVVMLVAGLVFGGIGHGLAGLWSGLADGARMVFRATMVLFGFTAISVELRNPVILARVERRRLRGLSDALGIAFGALPAFTAALGDARHLWRRPSLLAATLLRTANHLVTSRDDRTVRAVVILTGMTGEGKTTLASVIIERLRERRVSVAGILAPGLLADGHRTGFDLVDLATGERAPLAREGEAAPGLHARWSRFRFTDEGLALGRRALGPDAWSADVIFVDEVGPFELSGGGWAPSLDALTRAYTGVLVVVARETIVEDIKARWGATDTVVFRVPADPDEVATALLSRRDSALSAAR
jgi:nucleoside-triphosphatase THEP1